MIKVGDKLKPKQNFSITGPNNESIKLYTNRTYKVIRTDKETITVLVSKRLYLSFRISDALNAFTQINNLTFKWTNIYENNGFLKTTILWNTKEEAMSEYNDMKDVHPGVKLVKIQYSI